MARPVFARLCLLVAMSAAARTASAQAWVPPARSGSVGLVVQAIDHTGRLIDDGSRVTCCRTINVGIDVDVEYGLTDRFSISAGLPFVLAKYHDAPYNQGPAAFLPYAAADACQCWHGGFQDVEVAARYNLVNVKGVFVLTPSVSLGVPSHDYEYVGEAVIGHNLKQMRLGVDVGQRLDGLARGLAIQARYSYAVVPRVLDITHNRSNGAIEGNYAMTRRLSVRGLVAWQVTHGGLRFPQEVEPFPERYPEFHHLFRDNYLHAGGGVSYAWRDWDLSGSYQTAVRGTNSHTVGVYTVSVGRQFEVGGRR